MTTAPATHVLFFDGVDDLEAGQTAAARLEYTPVGPVLEAARR